MSEVKVESFLKIDGSEVVEVAQVQGLRFYENKGGDSLYIANPQGKVFVRIDTDCNQNFGFISHIKDMTNGKSVHGDEGRY